MTTQANEVVIWRNDIRHWFHIVQQEIITNQSIILNDIKHNQIYKVPLMSVTPIVMNSHSSGQSFHYTTSMGFYPMRNYYGMSQYNGQHIGDLVCMVSGTPRITFKQITDPTGVRNLIIAAQHGHYQ